MTEPDLSKLERELRCKLRAKGTGDGHYLYLPNRALLGFFRQGQSVVEYVELKRADEDYQLWLKRAECEHYTETANEDAPCTKCGALLRDIWDGHYTLLKPEPAVPECAVDGCERVVNAPNSIVPCCRLLCTGHDYKYEEETGLAGLTEELVRAWAAKQGKSNGGLKLWVGQPDVHITAGDLNERGELVNRGKLGGTLTQDKSPSAPTITEEEAADMIERGAVAGPCTSCKAVTGQRKFLEGTAGLFCHYCYTRHRHIAAHREDLDRGIKLPQRGPHDNASAWASPSWEEDS